MKRKKVGWRKLDNSAKIFPITSNKRFSTVFRVSVVLKKSVDQEVLQKAVVLAINAQTAFQVKLRKGFFWYYLEENEKLPIVEEEKDYPCRSIDTYENNGYLFKVTYFNRKINLDVFHSLTDGNTAIGFLQEIVSCYFNLLKGRIENKDKVISNNTEDSYLKHYKKEKAVRSKTNKAYILQGKKLSMYEIGVIHELIAFDSLKQVVKEKKATITEYLTAVLVYAIQQENYQVSKGKRPIKVCIPVNLKNYFPSTTSSNFFSYMNVEIRMGDQKNSFDEILEKVKHEFKTKLTQNEIEKTMDANVKIGNHFLIKLVPLLLKRFTLNLSYGEIRKYSTTTLSNLGKIQVKEEYQDSIDYFLFLLAPEPVEKIKCAICTYKNQLVFTFTSILVDKKIPDAFYQFIKKQGIAIQSESNGVYHAVSSHQKKK